MSNSKTHIDPFLENKKFYVFINFLYPFTWHSALELLSKQEFLKTDDSKRRPTWPFCITFSNEFIMFSCLTHSYLHLVMVTVWLSFKIKQVSIEMPKLITYTLTETEKSSVAESPSVDIFSLLSGASSADKSSESLDESLSESLSGVLRFL